MHPGPGPNSLSRLARRWGVTAGRLLAALGVVATRKVRRQRKTPSAGPAGSTQLNLLEGLFSPAGELEKSARAGPATKRHGRRLPGQTVQCGWCGKSTPIPARGRVPKWCSSTCRHRAWEQRRAAASGRRAVEVVDRVIETVRTEKAIEKQIVEVPVEHRRTTPREFAVVLFDLSARLDMGRIYDRDLPEIDEAMGHALTSLMRRLKQR